MKDRSVGDNTLHPRLTVAWMSGTAQVARHDGFAPGVTVVTPDVLERRLVEVAAGRRDRAAQELAQLDAEVRTVREERDQASAALAEVTDRRDELLDAAAWCDREPETAARFEQREQELLQEIDDQVRAARTANRQLERVLEQRAAADRALDDARRELADLGAVGVDETGVRRQLEQASSELRLASADYRTAMTEVARQRAHVEDLEAVRSGSVEEVRVDDSQLDLMRAALDAKYRSGAAPTSGDSAVDAARAALDEAQVAADRAATRLSEARGRIAAFEQELTRRSDDGAGADARRQAAAALEAQVASVEQRLAEAEAVARDEVEDATRAVARAEHELGRVRHDAREHRRRLQALSATVPAPPADADSGADAPSAWLARVLREDGAATDDEVARAQALVDALDERLAALDDASSLLRGDGPGGASALDRRTALQTLADEAPTALVLDGCVGPTGFLTVADLDDVDADVPVVVLTTDADVVSWAIELDAARGAVCSAHAVRAGLGADHSSSSSVADPPIRHTLECSP